MPLLLIAGDWNELYDLANYSRSEGSPLERQMASTILGQLCRYQGDPDSAWEMVREILPRGPASQPEDALFPYAMETLRTATRLLLDAGEPDRADEWLAAHDDWLEWSSAERGAAESATLRSMIFKATGRLDEAQEYAHRAVECASDPRQPLALIDAQRTLARIYLDRGDLVEAENILCCAYDLARACDAPLEEAMCEIALAELAQRQSRSPHDPLQLLTDARERATALGATPLLEQINPMLATLDRNTESASLTERELEVLRMVSQGLTDAEAAEQLFISPRTVSQHMRSVYNKLGVSSRSAATRWAMQHDLI